MSTHTSVITLDYLAGSVFHSPQKFGEALAYHLGGAVTLSRPRNGFTHGYAVEVQDVAQAEFHCTPGTGGPLWCFASGTKSQALWDFLTEGQYDWYVTRQDAACDVFDGALFPQLVQTAKDYAAANRMVTSVAGNWDVSTTRGRTFYLGARSSRGFHRIYEKGRKERTDPNWIRVEVEHKPQEYADRCAATQLTAPQIWAMHAGPIFGKVLQLDLAEVFQRPIQKPHRIARDTDRARRALADQYGKTIAQWLRDCGGDPQSFVAELLAGIDHQRAIREWANAPAVAMPELAPSPASILEPHELESVQRTTVS